MSGADHRSKNRRRYSLDFKRQVAAEANAGGVTYVAIGAKYGIAATVVRMWANGKAMERSDVGTGDPPAPPRATKAPKRTTSVALVVEATQRALEKTNGHAPGSMGAGTLIREVIQRLRSVGVHIEQITVSGDSLQISYTMKENVEL